jgi:hypothetical protein
MILTADAVSGPTRDHYCHICEMGGVGTTVRVYLCCALWRCEGCHRTHWVYQH